MSTERNIPGEEIGLRGPFPRNVRLGESGRGELYRAVGDVLDLKALWERSEAIRPLNSHGTFKVVYIREGSRNGTDYFSCATSSGVWYEFSRGSQGQKKQERETTVEEVIDQGVQKLVVGEPISEENGGRVVTEIVVKKIGNFSNDSERARQMPSSSLDQEVDELIGYFLTQES